MLFKLGLAFSVSPINPGASVEIWLLANTNGAGLWETQNLY
jgi:hypothetical protein